MATTTKTNETVGKTFKVVCTKCKIRTNHKVICSIDQSGKERIVCGNEFYDEWYYWSDNYQIIECQGCSTISFRSEHANSEDWDGEDSSINELIYPKRTDSSWNSKDFFNIPYNLRRIYRETIDCYNNDNSTLCAAGIRGLVEGLCKENGIIDGEVEKTRKDGTIIKSRFKDLQGKINGMHEKGILTKKHAEILHEHRYLGNKSIHELSIPSKDELNLALEIIEHVLDNIYEILEKGRKLKHKRLGTEDGPF
ncbi:MAG: DUF4145 domain-containing protein [Saprospiraceae bacterium]|nr:DUF4145 domain-containing protein [Saprospiraceae bacterium]